MQAKAGSTNSHVTIVRMACISALLPAVSQRTALWLLLWLLVRGREERGFSVGLLQGNSTLSFDLQTESKPNFQFTHCSLQLSTVLQSLPLTKILIVVTHRPKRQTAINQPPYDAVFTTKLLVFFFFTTTHHCVLTSIFILCFCVVCLI